PNKKRSIMLAFFMGLALSIGLAFLLEHLDNTLKGADDTEQKLGLPVLGLLPSLKTQDKKDLSPLRQFMAEPKSAFAEAIRTIRTGVLLSSLDDEHKVVLVTSSVPGEGKTTLSMNLARALSEMKRVLLIDADMRRPMVAKALDGDAQKGLSHFISGESDLKECLQKASDALYVMPAGVVPPNPLELLSSARFASALDKLGDHYDHIVIDCAPTLAVSDAMVLSKLASSVIYVVRADATPTQAAQAGIKRLRRVGAHVIGAVVNRAVRKHRPYYGKYSNYYGDSYYSDYGYVPEDRANRA
ncbi:MAG: polysaccharide biosynthesis tyrosine autokinase, partial [Pseudomonadota bacterium]